MSGFSALSHFNPLLVLVLGTLYSIGLYCIGKGLCSILFRQGEIGILARFAVGIMASSLVVQFWGMLHLNVSYGLVVLRIYSVLVMAAGIPLFTKYLFPVVSKMRDQFQSGYKEIGLFLIPVPLALLGMLVCCMAPSHRFDELHYHMLAPARLIADGCLRFYQMPVLGAIYPQMGYALGMAPLHALGYPDAGNVVSAALFLVFLNEIYQLLQIKNLNSVARWLVIVGLVGGTFSVTFYCASGSHSLVDCCMALAIVRLCLLEDQELVTPGSLLTQLVLCLGAIWAKLLIGPVAALVGLLSVLRFRRVTGKIFGFELLMGLLIGAFFYLPITIWSYWVSGAPFGPFLPQFMGLWHYHAGPAFTQDMLFFDYNASFLTWVLSRLSFNLAQFSVFIWLACLASPLLIWKQWGKWVSLAGLLLFVQLIVIHVCIYPEYRYLCGVQYAAFTVLVYVFSKGIVQRFNRGRFGWVILGGMSLPWVLLQVMYSISLIPVATGCESAWEYASTGICDSRDFRSLDSILPSDAVILVRGWGWPGYYLPRKVYMAQADIPPSSNVYLFAYDKVPEKTQDLVYENSRAMYQVHDVPFLAPRYHWFGVYKIKQE